MLIVYSILLNMRDKTTKKRIKVDYLLLIKLAGLESSFFSYVRTKKRVSLNRLGLAFLRTNHVDIERLYAYAVQKGFKTYDDLFKEECRIAKTPWLD